MKLKVFVLSLLCLAVMLPVGVPASAHGDECGLATLVSGYARATAPGAPAGAVFGYLINLGAEADTVVSAATAAAEAVEMHEMKMGDGDVMQMSPVEGGFVVGGHDFLELAPGGLHFMLIGLKQQLVAGEMLDLTITFEKAGEVQLQVPIIDLTAMEAGGEMVMGGSMEMTPEAMPAMSDWGDCAGIHVLGGWVRPANAAMPNSAAYVLLVNLTTKDDVLVSVETDVAASPELHEMTMGAGDVMQMSPVDGGIPVPAGSAVQLRPGGLHIMLIGLTQELAVGGMVEMTLTFAESDPMTLTLPIREPAEAPAGMSMSGG